MLVVAKIIVANNNRKYKNFHGFFALTGKIIITLLLKWIKKKFNAHCASFIAEAKIFEPHTIA